MSANLLRALENVASVLPPDGTQAHNGHTIQRLDAARHLEGWDRFACPPRPRAEGQVVRAGRRYTVRQRVVAPEDYPACKEVVEQAALECARELLLLPRGWAIVPPGRGPT